MARSIVPARMTVKAFLGQLSWADKATPLEGRFRNSHVESEPDNTTLSPAERQDSRDGRGDSGPNGSSSHTVIPGSTAWTATCTRLDIPGHPADFGTHPAPDPSGAQGNRLVVRGGQADHPAKSRGRHRATPAIRIIATVLPSMCGTPGTGDRPSKLPVHLEFDRTDHVANEIPLRGRDPATRCLPPCHPRPPRIR